MTYDIQIGKYKLGMLDKVEVHKSVELLADTAEITLPAAQFNTALDVEQEIKRGDSVLVRFGYKETGIVEEFKGWLQRISTDGGSIKLYCEDDLFVFRTELKNEQLKKISLEALLQKVVSGVGKHFKIVCDYKWIYAKFTINNATGYDVLKKVQEECGADIYLKDGTLHVHPPGAVVGKERYYDFAKNVEKADLTYRNAVDKKYKVVVKSNMPDGTVKEIEVGSTGGDKIEVKCATSDAASMKARGELELRRRCFDGYDGNITTWLVPECRPGDTATLHDGDYPKKDGTYFVRSVTTTFGSDGGKRKIDLGFRLS